MKFSLVFIVCLVTTAAAQTTESNPLCGPTSYYCSSGNITSPNYPGYYYNDLNCDYNVYGSEGGSITFTFAWFHVEPDLDVVTISCPTNLGFPSEEYTGHSLPSAVTIPSCSHGLVNFRTNFDLVNTGFRIVYECTAPETTMAITTAQETTVAETTMAITTAQETTVAETTMAITTAQETTVAETTMAATTVNMETTAQDPTTAQEMAATTVNMETTAQQPTIAESTIVADTTNFKTTYPPAATTFPQDTTSVPGTTDAIQTTHPEPVSTVTSDLACGETSYYGPTGVISSPNYPFLYNRDINCNYYVYASTGSSISFIFKAFDTEQTFDTVTISCPTNSSFAPKTFSGKSVPNPVSIPWCSLGLVNFKSDDSTVDTGFSLNYYVSEGGCGNTVYNESQGYVTSPNWPSEYGNDHSCLNIIWAPQRSTFNLIFESFNLHSCCSCDWLEIRCLDNSEYGPYKYCGSNSFGSLSIYECSQTLLWFSSDSSLSAAGFNIQYNVYLEGETTGVDDSMNFQMNSPSPKAGCGSASYSGPSGVITSPNYPANYDNSLKCQYYINATTGSSIALIFEHFDMEQDKDYVAITCETNTSFPEQRFSGQTLPPPLSIPWCSHGGLFFFTDTEVVFSGYSIDYLVSEGGCGNTVYTESSGNVTSPNFPSNYGDNLDCYNIIWAPEPSHFYLEYTDFNVQFSEPCSIDYVEISCLDNNPSNKHRFCGSTVYSLDFYQCTQVLVWFHTDSITIAQGFNLEYNINLVSGCGEESYYGPSGVIKSPNFPGFYNNSLYCDYGIYTSSPDGSIAIFFETFFTEECCDFVTISCPTNSSYTPVTYSGYIQEPPPVSIPWCSQGLVNFRTDISTGSPGFSLNYTVSVGGCGDTVYTAMPGSISSPNYPSNYGDNQDCSNIIWVEKAINFAVTFVHLNTEECCDFVEISCLDNPAYVKQKFSGTTLPLPQTIPECSQVLVRFFSDITTTFDGFSLEYSAAPPLDSDIHS